MFISEFSRKEFGATRLQPSSLTRSGYQGSIPIKAPLGNPRLCLVFPKLLKCWKAR